MDSPLERSETPGGGERVGPYRLVERLAAGGMGEVWRAWDERLKRPVAVKQILPQRLSQAHARERFRREAEAGARLSHPSIVQIHDLVERPDGDWIVMELVEGQSLRQALCAGPMPVRQAARLAGEIAQGLAAAHARGILHRDLKAANVMVTQDGHAKILDFGIAKAPAEEGAQDLTLSRPGEVIGTAYAMSPEQVLGFPLDPRSDLFSLGSLLYEMVTGKAPFLAETSAATLARVCSFRPLPVRQLRPEVPPELADLIARLLEKEPAARPVSAEEVAAALLRAATRMDLDPAPPAMLAALDTQSATLVEPRGRFDRSATGDPLNTPLSRRRRTLAGVLATAAVGLLLVLGLAWQGGRLAVGERPPDSYALYERGLTALSRYDKKGNLDAAITDFRQILAQDPGHAPAHAALARACQLQFTNQKDPMWLQQALPLAERAVRLDAHLASARVSLGLVYQSLGRLDEAARELEHALRLEPLNADAYFGLAKVYEARTQLDQAEAAYMQAIQRRADRQFYDALGTLYLRTGRVDQSIAAFQQSVRLAPDGALGYRNLGAAYYSKDDLEQAATQFQKALEIEPMPAIYANLGTVFFTQGLYPEAVEAFEKALELPDGANDYLYWANLADACRWAPGQDRKAREAYSRALQLLEAKLGATPQNATLGSRRAVYLAKRGDCAPSLAASGELDRLPEMDAASLLRLAVAREVCGRREAALATLEKALRAGLPPAEVQSDPELLGLRGDVRYHRLMVQFADPS